MIIHVRNFGKIESANIDLSDLVVFVGENNSGKTYLMQLIYGLFSFFNNILTKETIKVFSELKDENENITIQPDNFEFYNSFQNALNNYIDEFKNVIIERVFHTNSLTVDSLWIEFDPLSDVFSLTCDGKVERNGGYSINYFIYKNDIPLSRIGFNESIPQDIIYRIMVRELTDVLLSELTGPSMNADGRRWDEKPFIYLPASRSGIMLLYANYLSNDKKSNGLEIERFTIERNTNNDTENEYGLTEPVYNFLMFLLKHKSSEMATEENKELISFIDNNIINGHFEKIGNTMRYKPQSSDQSIPIYLSSSLVSELAPIYQIISGIQRFNYIMYDEIETCQHPTKQLQLARLLVRMVNAGYKMMVSTHSDTMAAAVNNLITLSSKKNKTELMDKLGYEEDDILQAFNVKAYQFIIGDNGKTKVVEVPSHFSLGIGFDFDLFNVTNDKIYQDAKALAEVE